MKKESQKRAKKLFGKINQIETDFKHRKTLYKHAVFAFENMRLKDSIDSFDQITDDNFNTFLSIFNDYKDIESTYYYEITSGRIKIIEKLKKQIDGNELEKILQQNIFDNLWLLDPSWERATEAVYLEKRVKIQFDNIDKPKFKEGRIDLQYRKTSGKNIIIELKRANVQKSLSDIIEQVVPYIEAVNEELKLLEKNEPVEAIYIVGTFPKEWKDSNKMEKDKKTLETQNIRVLTYQGLINQSYILYSEYMNRQTDQGKTLKLLKEIECLDQPSEENE